jgi:hypothetical protein
MEGKRKGDENELRRPRDAWQGTDAAWMREGAKRLWHAASESSFFECCYQGYLAVSGDGAWRQRAKQRWKLNH